VELFLSIVLGFGAILAAGALFNEPRSSLGDHFRQTYGGEPVPTKYERRWRTIALWGFIFFCIWGLAKLGAFSS
jgi:hypothetical protein